MRTAVHGPDGRVNQPHLYSLLLESLEKHRGLGRVWRGAAIALELGRTVTISRKVSYGTTLR